MAWDEIKFKISADMDFGDAKAQVSTIKKGIQDLKETISEMPNVSRILDNSLERSATVVDSLTEKMEKLHSGQLSDKERTKIEKRASNDVLELNALRDIQLGTTDYSTIIARKWFGDLPTSIKRQFDVMMPQLATIIRSRMSSLSKYGNGVSSISAGAIARTLMGAGDDKKIDADISRLMQQYKLTAEARGQLQDAIKYLVPTVSPMHNFRPYQQKRYGFVREGRKAELFSGKPEDLFPESFKETFRSKGTAFQTFDKSYQGMVLGTEQRKKLNEILRTNPVAVKAAIQSGISRRDKRGVLETQDEITRPQWEAFRKSLYDDLLIRVSGFKGSQLDAYKATGKDKKTLMSRLTSSSSGRAMLAMHDIEAFEDPRLWVNSTSSGTWSKLPQEGKRILDEYVVGKYSPFAPGGSFTKPRKVMISESHNTRLLGGKQWTNNQDVSDTIAVVSLDGYDAKNLEHQKSLEALFSKEGKKIGGRTYVAQSIHGTGKDTIVRMVEKSAYDRVEEQERQWIASHPDEAVRGIRGSYWRGYDDAEIERLIKEGVTAKDWGKHLEMLNKPWTPSQEVGVDIGGKKFAVVNTKGFGDGGAWFANSVMPHSGQFRGGVGLKGSAFVFQGKGMKDFGERTGMLDKEGRLMMEGPDDQMYDVSGYDGIIPLDVIKNKGILKDENGNFVSGDVASRRMTAMLERHPMSYHVDYDLEDTASGHLGTQMASFMMLSPKVREHQIEMAMKVMRELDTEDGQIKHVFSNEDDYLSRKIADDTSLLSTDEARARVDAKRASIFRSLLAGQYTDFEDDTQIANLRAAASPLASMLLARDGIIPDSTIKKAREYLQADAEAKKAENPDYVAPEYTDQDIRDMIILPQGKIIDFNRKDQQKVAVVRAPTGFGNMYNAENLAAAAEPIYRGFGISTTAGMYVSEQDRDRLQTMDFDADQVKAIYDQEIAESIEETLKVMEYKKPDIKGVDISYTPEELRSWSIQNRLAAERNISASLGMGTGSAGIRIMQIDYSQPWAEQLVRGAQRMAGVYDIASTPKAAQTYNLDKDDPVWKALGLGKEYTKFSEKRSDLFKYDDDMLDEFGKVIPEHEDLYRAKNGKYVNLRALREMGIDEINLPSRYMANHLMGITEANDLYRSGMVDTSEMDAIYEAMNNKLGFGDAGDASRRLMQTMRMLHIQFGTGERAYISDTEARYIDQLADAAESEIDLAAKQLDPKERAAFIAKKQKEFGVRTARNATGAMGITEKELVDMFGEEQFRSRFQNVTDSIGMVEADRAIELQQQEEETDKQINEIKSRNKKGKGKSKKKASTERKALNEEIAVLAKALELDKDIDIDEEIKNAQRNLEADEITLDALRDMGGTASEKQITSQRDLVTQGRARLQGLQKYKALTNRRDHTPEEISLDELLERRAQIEREKEANLRAIDIRTEYEQLRGQAKEYNQQLWGYQKGKENKILDEKTAAEKYWSRNFYEGQSRMKPLLDFAEKIEASDIPENSKQEMIKGITALQADINDNIQKDFTNKSILFAKSLSENIEDELNKEQKAVTPQKKKLDEYDQSIGDAKSFVSFMQDKLATGNVDKMYQQMYEEAIEETNKYIASAEEAKAKLVETYTKKNEQAGKRSLESLQIKHGLRNKNSLSVRSDARKEEIQNLRDIIDKEHAEGNYSEEAYAKITSQLDALEAKASKTSVAIQDTMNRAGQIIGRVAQRLGRQLFMKALQETKRFIKEFDSSMNEIQAITLKSNSDMQDIRSRTVSKALGLRTSVSNVANVEAALYRQGLSDQEVSSRTESIIKFATVTKLNVQEATKIITTALQNDLVPSAEAAMDALVALGDSAATTAAEIGKGMQKAAASAKVAGVSYAELTALLTIGTSDTQLSGTQVGTALQTVFSRMRRMSISGWTSDQNGDKTTASDAEAALKSVGVDLWDDKAIGKMRTAYEVLSDLSKVWQNLSDAQKNIVMNAMAGTRQTNVFSTLMEGMSEDGGATLEKYLGLAEGSQGITQSKYEIAMQSLSAAMDELKSSWDSVVESFTNSGAITGTLDFVSNTLQGIANIVNNGGQIGVVLSAVAAGITAIVVATSGIAAGPAGILLQILSALAVFAVGGGLTAGFTSLLNVETEADRINRTKTAAFEDVNKQSDIRDKNISSKQSIINEVKELGRAYDELQKNGSAAEQAIASNKLTAALGELKSAFPEVSDEVQKSIEKLANWEEAVEAAKTTAENYTKQNAVGLAHDIQFAHSSYTQDQYNLDKKANVVDESRANEIVYEMATAAMAFADTEKYRDEEGYFDLAKFSKKGAYGERANFLEYLLGSLAGKSDNSDLIAVVEYLKNNYGGVYNDFKTDKRSVISKNADTVKRYAEAASGAIEYFLNKEIEDLSNVHEIATDEETISTLIGDYAGVFAKMATDEISAEDIQAMLTRDVLSRIYANGERSQGPWFNENGLVTEEIDKAVVAFIEDWYKNGNAGVQKVVKDNKRLDEYKYNVAGVGFDDYDKATAYALNNGLTYFAVKDKSGNSVYQTADQLISAQRQQANATNEQQRLQRVLYGQQYGQSTEDLAKLIAGEQREGEDNRAYQMRLRGIAQQLATGTIDTKAYTPGGIREYSNLDDFKNAYSKFGLDSELANVVANTPEALIGYLTDSYETFAQALENAAAGKATTQSTALQMSNLMNLFANNPDFINTLRTDESLKNAYSSIQSYFGDNTDNILNAMLAGTYAGTDLETLVNNTIAEKGIALGTGIKQFTSVDVAKLAQQVLAKGDWAEAQKDFGWTTDEWSALESKYPALKQYLQMTEAQQLSQEGQNLKREIEIQMSVAGVSELEEANKVLEGTTSLIQNLQKGGEIAIKASLDFESNVFNNQQQKALLESDNFTEQLGAIASITGLSNLEIQQIGYENALQAARAIVNEREVLTGKSLNAISRSNVAEAERQAKKAGYKNYGGNMTVDEAIKEIQSRFGGTYQYDEETGTLYTMGAATGDRYVYDAVQRVFKSLIPNYQLETDAVGNPVYENLAYGTTKSRSAIEIAKNRAALINQELTHETVGRNDEYVEAYNALGQYGKDYLAMLDENRAEQTAGRKAKYDNASLERARAKAIAENNEALAEAEEQQAIEDARISATTASGAMTYANLRYQQNNKAGLAANALYETLSTANISNVADVIEILDSEDGLKNWKDLLETTPELIDEFKNMGNAVTEDGQIDWSAIEEQENGLSKALSDLIDIIASYSKDYQDVLYKTRDDIYEEAELYAANPESKEFSDAYASIVGSDIAARVKRARLAVGENEDTFFLTPEEQNYADTLMENYRNGIVGLTQRQKLQGADEMLKVIKQGRDEYQSVYGNASQDMIDAYADAVPGLRELIAVLNDASTSEKELAKRTSEVETELKAAGYAAEHYSDYTDEATNSMRNLGKGGKSALQEVAKLKKQLLSLQDVVTASSKIRGKSGKQLDSKTKNIVANYLGIDSKDVEKYTKEELSKMADQMEKAAQEEFNEQQFKPFLGEAFKDINKAIQGGEITYEQVVDVVTKVNKEGDISAFADLLAQIGSEYAAVAESYAGNIVSYLIEVVQQLGKDSGLVDVNASVEKSNAGVSVSKSGGYNGGGGGGGGSEKSELDKMLERQKHQIAALEHAGKMLDIYAQGYDFTNSFGAWQNNIDEQISNQESLRSAYASNLSELRAQLGAVEQGSDDYYKLTDAINSAEEAMASISNTINELNAKKIQIIAEKQENEDKPVSHKLSMLSKYASRYQTSGQFESYADIMGRSIEETREQIKLNNSQIEEWEGLLKTYYENSDSWIEVRDKIWALKEENAELENQAASDLIDLQTAKVAQIAEDLSNENLGLEHANNVLGTFGEIYQSTNQRANYRSTLADTIENNQKLKESTDAAIQQVKEEMAGIESTSPAYLSALQTLYQLEEASAQYEASILSSRQAMEESLIEGLKEKHADSASVLEHEMKLLDEAQKEFLRENDFINYENILEQKARNAAEQLEEQKRALADYLELQNSGDITEGSQQWKDLEQTIRETKESIAELTNEEAEARAAVQQAQFENLQKVYKEGYKTAESQVEGTDQLQHELQLIQYEQTRYQNNGQLTNYGTMLGMEKANLEAQRKAIQDQITATKKLQETHKDNPELYEKETEYIRKLEEELRKTTNSIEKNTEAQKKNQQAILATQMAVKNAADKSVREIIQKERSMLAATTSVQNTILDVIRKRFEKEWKLEKDSIEKKKQALNEEKNLITDRLNFRKKMMDEETKAEELAEYKRQLALISADTTRTKDANELRRKINEMEKEQAIQTAEDVAAAEQKAISDRAQAWTDYETVQEEDLSNLLANANNFREELDNLMSGSFEDFVAWNEKYNEDYMNKTDEQRKQMQQGWDDTWTEMLGMVKTYWDEVDEASRTKEGWMALVTSTDSFLSKSAEEQEYLYQQYEDTYDAMLKAQISNATFDDDHEIINTINNLKDWTFSVKLADAENYVIQSGYTNKGYIRNHNLEDYIEDTDYAGVGKVYVEPAPSYSAPVDNASSGSGNGSGSGKQRIYYVTGSGYIDSVYGTWDDVPRTAMHASTSLAQVQNYAAGTAPTISVSNMSEELKQQKINEVKNSNIWGNNNSSSTQTKNIPDKKVKNIRLTANANGGLVDYTGLTWVDGTKTRPESFLDATDTKLLRSMLDAFTYVKTTPYMTHLDNSNFGNGSVNVGDVNVNLYEAKLEDDADYDTIAQKVGKAFTKQLQKDGFNLAQYAW